MRRLFSNTTIDFVGVRRYAYAITAAFFIPGLLLLGFRGLNYSIEFTGGTLVRIKTAAVLDQGAVRAGLDAQGVHGAEIQSFGSAGEFVIRARTAKVGSDADDTGVTTAAVQHALDGVLGTGKYSVVRTEAVGPKVGGELRQQALLAIFLSFFAILAYLAYRFEWRFGAAAIAATAHDVMGTVIFVSLMQFEVSLVVVGGVLSVLGLSLNETIIIFDRVRENEHRKLPGDLATVLNHSINETLPRTVLTHGTSLSTMLTLIIFGGEVIRPFAMVMFWGVFTGIFSSMYIAPSVLLWIRKRWPPAHGAAVKPATRKA
jgi:preprotein translocase subunit SecF